MNNKTQKLLERADKWISLHPSTQWLATEQLVKDLVAHISAGIDSRNELLQALKEARELIDGEIDIDNNGGPNTAMKLATIIDASLSRAEASAIDDGEE